MPIEPTVPQAGSGCGIGIGPHDMGEQILVRSGQLPDLGQLRAHFALDPGSVPQLMMQLAPLASYECLIGACQIEDAA